MNRFAASLSDMTPARIRAVYGIDAAEPVDTPIFLFLIGSPGAGKSSGHRWAIERGLLPPTGYATINLDLLLENMLPFRVASAIGHLLKQRHENVRFSSIPAYGSRQENLGLFDWYNADHARLGDPSLDPLREQFRPLQGQEAAAALRTRSDAAIQEAIGRRIPIVYETTFSVNRSGRVDKLDHIMEQLAGSPYRVAVLHVRAVPADIIERIHARQEYNTPFQIFPFYRYIPVKRAMARDWIESNAKAYRTIQKQYPQILAMEIENPLDAARLPPPRRERYSKEKRRILRAYGPTRRNSSRTLSTSWRVSTPPTTSNLSFRLSSSQRARTRKHRTS
jgi:hypothetical protein